MIMLRNSVKFGIFFLTLFISTHYVQAVSYIDSFSVVYQNGDDCTGGGVYDDGNGYFWNTNNYAQCSGFLPEKSYVLPKTQEDGYKYWVFSRYGFGGSSYFGIVSEFGDAYNWTSPYVGGVIFTDFSNLRSEAYQGIPDSVKNNQTNYRGVVPGATGVAYPGPYYYAVVYTSDDLSWIDTRQELYGLLDNLFPGSDVYANWEFPNNTNTGLGTGETKSHFLTLDIFGGSAATTHYYYNLSTDLFVGTSPVIKTGSNLNSSMFPVVEPGSGDTYWWLSFRDDDISGEYRDANECYLTSEFVDNQNYDFTFTDLPVVGYTMVQLYSGTECHVGEQWSLLSEGHPIFTPSSSGGITVDVSYFLDPTELNVALADKNVTMLSYAIAKRPDTNFSRYGVNIDNTIAGTSTSQYTFSSLTDGTYDIKVNFANAGSPITGIYPLGGTYMLSSFTLSNGIITDVQPAELYNNYSSLGTQTTGASYQQCTGITDISCHLINAALYLFYPNPGIINNFKELPDLLSTKAPFAYSSQALNQFNSATGEVVEPSTFSLNTSALGVTGMASWDILSPETVDRYIGTENRSRFMTLMAMVLYIGYLYMVIVTIMKIV